MRSVETGSRSITSETGEMINLKYYLVVQEVLGGGLFAFESYGVRVEQDKQGVHTAAQCDYITCSMDKIDKLLHAITRGSVTPVTLADVVEDWE